MIDNSLQVNRLGKKDGIRPLLVAGSRFSYRSWHALWMGYRSNVIRHHSD